MQESGDNSLMRGLDNGIIVNRNQHQEWAVQFQCPEKNVCDYLNYLNIILKIRL